MANKFANFQRATDSICSNSKTPRQSNPESEPIICDLLKLAQYRHFVKVGNILFMQATFIKAGSFY
jgi:hypothetical protein